MMALAKMISVDRDALICDMAETYHIYDLRGLPARTLATLAFGLRADSRIKMRLSDQPLRVNTILLAAIADRLGLLVWAQTEDGRRAATGRSPLLTPSRAQRTARRDTARRKSLKPRGGGSSMATELAKAYVQILPTTKGMTNNLRAQMDAPAAAAGVSAGSKIGSAIKKAIAAIGIGAAIKSAVTEGMDLEQNLGGTEVVFGEFARNIQETAKIAYKNMGASASEYMAKANIMASLFQGSGISQAESLDLTTKAMQRAADVASVMGIDTSMALDSIAGAAKGNFTMMDNLGVAMNATTLSAYALEKGINFDWNTASNAEKRSSRCRCFSNARSSTLGTLRENRRTRSPDLWARLSPH